MIYNFPQINGYNDQWQYTIAKVLIKCLADEAAAEVAKVLCVKLSEGFETLIISPYGVREVLDALATCQPVTYLDSFLNEKLHDSDNLEWNLMHEEFCLSLNCIDDSIFQKW